MKKVYTLKCNNCGTVKPETEINLISEDTGYCHECFNRAFSQCDYCKEFIPNRQLTEVTVNEELYDLCNYCFEEENWDKKFNPNSINEEFEDMPIKTNSYYYDYNHPNYEDVEEVEEKEDEPNSHFIVNESLVKNEDNVEDFYKNLINHK